MSIQSNTSSSSKGNVISLMNTNGIDAIVIALALIGAYLVCTLYRVGDSQLLAGAVITIVGYFFGGKNTTVGFNAGTQAASSNINSNSGNSSN